MRQLGLGLLLFLAVGATADATATLGVDSATYDFGAVIEGTMVTHAFILRNGGNATLDIASVRAACGCTTTALPTSSLAPGESVALEARVDTSNFSGRIMKEIYVDSNDPANPTAVLTVQGEVEPLQPYNITPSDLKYLFLLIIDVRDPTPYAAGHLWGAVNIPASRLSLWTEILPRDVILVLYDSDGQESGVQAKYLQSVGFPQARSLAGGLAAWSLLPGAVDYVVGALPSLPEPTAGAVEAYEMPNGDLRLIYLVVIDLRTPQEYANPGGHFLGAVNIPAGDLAQWEASLPRDAEIVLYDQTGGESDRQAERLQGTGFTKLHSLAGGYDAWVQLYGISCLIAERQ
jgi:rhodanese-related sulfurtransferase